MNIIISDKLKNKCHNVCIASIEAYVKVEDSSEELLDEINKKCDEIKEKYIFEDVIKIKNIEDSRKAYKLLGKDPSRYRLSSESLVKRIVKGNGLYRVNNIVDINNLVSLESCYSVGTYDVNKIDSEVIFTVADKGEFYEGIGRGQINLESLPVFEDIRGKFGSTTSDSMRAMITAETKHIIMNIISFNGDSELEEYMDYSIDLLKRYGNATILNRNTVK